MSKYYKVEDVEMLMVFSGICDGKTCGEIVKALQSLPTIEVSDDCIDRYSALAELDPRSYEYKAVKELPSVIPKPEKSECPYFIDGVWCNLVGKEMKGADDE